MSKVFQKHNIERLSVSTINQWIEQPALALLKLAGIKDKTNSPSAWRGTSTDKALTKIILNNASESSAIEFALQTFEEEKSLCEDFVEPEKIEKEKKSIIDYVKVGRQFYSSLTSSCIDSQGKIDWEMEDIDVPFIGFYDLLYEDYVRDIKTTRVAPISCTRRASRQLALYSKATGKDPHVDYITKKEVRSFKVTNVEDAYKDLQQATLALKRVLSYSDDIFECCRLVHPDIDDWRWGETTREKAKEIWNI